MRDRFARIARCVRWAAPIGLLALVVLLPSWPAALDLASPIPSDSTVTVDRLANGLAYSIRRNGWPENRIELRLLVRAGSLHEDDDQLGLAHFVEHMAFNGSEHFPPGEVVRYFESIGARFGADLNASTTFDRTLYRLDVPAEPESLVERGLLLFADFAAAIAFADEEIDKERGVVLEEWRGRLGAGDRMLRRVLPVLYHGARHAERLPIGTPESIQNAPPGRLRDFYRQWYAPDRMAVCIVGAIDPGRAAALVERYFGPLPARREFPPAPSDSVPLHASTLVAIATDPEARASSVSLVHKYPRPPYRTVADYRASLLRSFALGMLNQRFSELAREPEAPFVSAFASISDLGRTLRTFSVGASVQDGGIEPGLQAVVVELRRALEHGFTAAEFERMKSSMRASIERQHKERERTESAALVGAHVAHFLEGTPYPSATQRFQLFEALVPTLSLDEAHATLRDLVASDSRVLVAQAPEKEGLAPPTESGLRAALAGAESIAVAPWHDALAGRALLERQPVPGPVRSRRTVAAAGVTVLELANGVRVWLKPTDFKKDEVLFAAQAPGGYSLAAPERYPGLSYTAEIVSEAGAGGFTPVDLQKLLAGKLAGARVTLDDFSQGISGSSAPQDLETALQLVHLWFTSPNDRPAALEIIQKRLRTSLANRARDPDAAFSDRVAAVNSSDHYMERPITLAEVEALEFPPVLDFYRARVANAADFTFFFVGAFDPAALEPLLERYLGSLPSGGARRSQAVERPYRFPAGTTSVDVRSGSEPKSRTALAFFADARGDRDQLFRLNAACELLEIRLRDRLREDLGSTYSVAVGYADAWPVRGYGRVGVWFGGAPESRDRMEAAALQVVRKLRDEGPTAGEVGRVQEILRRELELDEKRNGWWLGVLQTCEERGWKMLGAEARRRRIDALTASALREACRRYLPLDRWTRVSLLPESAPAATDSSAAPGGSSGR